MSTEQGDELVIQTYMPYANYTQSVVNLHVIPCDGYLGASSACYSGVGYYFLIDTDPFIYPFITEEKDLWATTGYAPGYYETLCVGGNAYASVSYF